MLLQPITAMTELELLGIILLLIVWFIINLLVSTFFLKLALGIVDARKTDFSDVLVTSLIITLLSMILFVNLLLIIIGLLIIWYLISKRHNISYLMAIIVSILAIIIAVIVLIIIGILIGVILGITVPLALIAF